MTVLAQIAGLYGFAQTTVTVLAESVGLGGLAGQRDRTDGERWAGRIHGFRASSVIAWIPQ